MRAAHIHSINRSPFLKLLTNKPERCKCMKRSNQINYASMSKYKMVSHATLQMLTPSLADLHVGSLDVSNRMADGIPARILRSSHSIAPAGAWTTFEKWGEGTASRIDFVACNESQTLSMIINFGCSFALTACTHINISLKSRGLQLPQPPPLAYTFALPLLNCSTCQLQVENYQKIGNHL